jgi:hypothetical protein
LQQLVTALHNQTYCSRLLRNGVKGMGKLFSKKARNRFSTQASINLIGELNEQSKP